MILIKESQVHIREVEIIKRTRDTTSKVDCNDEITQLFRKMEKQGANSSAILGQLEKIMNGHWNISNIWT